MMCRLCNLLRAIFSMYFANQYELLETYPRLQDMGSLYLNTDLPDVSLPTRPANIAFDMFAQTPAALQGSLTHPYLHILSHLLR